MVSTQFTLVNSGRGGYNGPNTSNNDDEDSRSCCPVNFGRGGYNAPSEMVNAGRGGYNRGGDDDEEEDGRGGYN